MTAQDNSDGYKAHVLVIRLSALGDVAILCPIVNARAKANPDVLFTVAGPPLLEPLFRGQGNVRYLPLKKRQAVKELYRQMAAVRPTMVADMHYVNRVIGADCLFRLHGVPVRHIHKDRSARRRLARKGHRAAAALKPSWKRYDEVFDACGLTKGDLDLTHWQPKGKRGETLVGIAPFAQHRGKIWPEAHVRKLIELLSSRANTRVLLFGGRDEAATLEQWCEGFGNVCSMAGRLSFEEELQHIASLNVLVSMDSANMHFASCLGVPVVSVWGATHPAAGFEGWRQDPEWSMGVDLPCRPCSIYGNKPCRYGDYRCLWRITPQEVYEKVLTFI